MGLLLLIPLRSSAEEELVQVAGGQVLGEVLPMGHQFDELLEVPLVGSLPVTGIRLGWGGHGSNYSRNVACATQLLCASPWWVACATLLQRPVPP